MLLLLPLKFKTNCQDKVAEVATAFPVCEFQSKYEVHGEWVAAPPRSIDNVRWMHIYAPRAKPCVQAVVSIVLFLQLSRIAFV